MQRVPADLIPRIARKWGQKNTTYKMPFHGREHRWVQSQQDLFRRYNPIYACDHPKKTTPYNTRLYFNQRNVTGFGGMFLPIAFLERLGLGEALNSVFDHKGYEYSTSDLLRSALACIFAGAPRLYDINTYRFDPGLCRALGLDQLPEEGNLRKRLDAAGKENVQALQNVLFEGLATCNQTEEELEIGLDIDTTQAVVYGKQEQAAVGYNPQKKGRPCYQIAVAFIANNGDLVRSELRPGNTHSLSGFEAFFKETVASLPTNYKVRFVRMDKGFFDQKAFSYLEEQGVKYVCAAKITSDLLALARTLRDYEKVQHPERRIFITEVDYRYGTWDSYRRMVIFKEQIANPNYDPDALDLLGQPVEPEYFDSYRFYVTNIGYDELDAQSVWRFYNERATVENRIKESKIGFSLDKLPNQHFWGNAFYVQLVSLAYNLLNWFKRFLLPAEFRSKSIRWLRMNLLLLPALIVRKKLQWFIKYPRHYSYKKLLFRIHRRLAEGKPYYVV